MKFIQFTLLSLLLPFGGCGEYLGNAGPDHCGAVEGDEVWSKASNPHVITCSTTVSGSVLIGPGTKVQFSEGAELIVTGGIVVEGTAEEPVLFESSGGATFAGLSVRGNGGETHLSHLTISGGGYSENGDIGALTIDSGPVKLTDVKILNAFSCGLSLTRNGRLHADSEGVTIKGSTGYALCSDVQSVQSIDESIFTLQENGSEGLKLTGASLSGYHNWTMTSMPYVVGETFTLSKADLVIGAGVLLQFERYHSILVGAGADNTDARLTTLGEPERPVRLTGVDQEPGAWGGIYVDESAGAQRVHLNHTTLENGGSQHGYGYGLLSTGENVEIHAQNLVIKGAEEFGFSFDEGSGWSADSANITVTENGATGQMSADMVKSLPGSTDLSGNTLNRVTVDTKEIENSADWVDYGSSYGMLEGLETNNAGTEELVFTVGAGVILEFAEGEALELGESGTASVSFNGTEANPVVLRGLDSDEDGFWAGVQFSGGLSSATWHHVKMYDGGLASGAGLRLDGGYLAVDHVSVEGSAGAGFRVRSGGFVAGGQGLIVTNNEFGGESVLKEVSNIPQASSSYTGNGIDLIELSDSYLSESILLQNLGVPYNLVKGINASGTEEKSVLVTVEAGTHVLFEESVGININDHTGLVAQGTAEDVIVFSSVDPGVIDPWSGIHFRGEKDGASILQHVEVGYGGSSRAAIVVDSGDPVIRDAYVHHSACYGILVYNPLDGPVVQNVTYSNNACGDYSETYP